MPSEALDPVDVLLSLCDAVIEHHDYSDPRSRESLDLRFAQVRAIADEVRDTLCDYYVGTTHDKKCGVERASAIVRDAHRARV